MIECTNRIGLNYNTFNTTSSEILASDCCSPEALHNLRNIKQKRSHKSNHNINQTLEDKALAAVS